MNLRALTTITSILLIAVAPLIWASEQSGAGQMQEIIRSSFGTDENAGFKMKTNSGNYVEICGDSCAFFRWHGAPNDERYWRFIVLYEIRDAPGTDVAAFLHKVNDVRTDALLEGTSCKLKGDDISTLECNWGSYAEGLNIVVGHSRYDEGYRCYSTIVDWHSMKSSKWKCVKAKPQDSPFRQ